MRTVAVDPMRAFVAAGGNDVGRRVEPGAIRFESAVELIRLGNNESPYGAGPAVRTALTDAVGRAHRYPGAFRAALISAIAETHDIPREYVLISGGSGDIFKAAVYAFTSPTRSLVTARPIYEAPTRTAQHIGTPVVRVPLAQGLRLDLQGLAARAGGAGLIYLCNPHNPTGTAVTSAEITAMCERLARTKSRARILVDEAYFGYADMPAIGTALPLVSAYRHLIVTRSFSKIHGMAGMRVGYAVAHPDTLQQLRSCHSTSSLGALSLHAATASLGDPDHLVRVAALNRSVRDFVVDVFRNAGYAATASQANFVFVDLKRDSRVFQQACLERGVQIGRAFPPLIRWARITLGTYGQMEQALAVFGDILQTSTPHMTSGDTMPRPQTPAAHAGEHTLGFDIGHPRDGGSPY